MWKVENSSLSKAASDAAAHARSRLSWPLWLVPLACWAVYLCWMAGYQNGYESGHDDGWNRARKVINGGATQLVDLRRSR
jgi:hypothetical protein